MKIVRYLNKEALQHSNGYEDDESTDEEETGSQNQLHVQTEQHHRLPAEPGPEGRKTNLASWYWDGMYLRTH